jgi:U6 snRNA-associated Sm-like protein LSm4
LFDLVTIKIIVFKTFGQLVELKNGETFNGHLVSCDNWMNINLREVICTSREGDKFWRMNECYIRGPMIKYLRIPDEVIDTVKEEVRTQQHQYQQSRGRGQNNHNNQRDNNQRDNNQQNQRRQNKRPAGPSGQNNRPVRQHY